MTSAESLALAMLRSGCSYDDAMRATHLTLDQLKALYEAAPDRLASIEGLTTSPLVSGAGQWLTAA